MKCRWGQLNLRHAPALGPNLLLRDDRTGSELKVYFIGFQDFYQVTPGNPDYVEGFSTLNPVVCDAAVPPDTTVVVVKGEYGEDAIVFRGNGIVSTVFTNGKLIAGNVGTDFKYAPGEHQVQRF